jgi:uncharacterized metal-binding protein YceD (DUF177 family)
MIPASVEFSRPLPVDRVPREGSTETIEAEPKELAALALRLGVPALHALSAELRAEPWRGGGLKVAGRFTADLDQICVVTLEQFRDTVEGPVERVYLPETAVTGGDEEDADHIVDGTVDLGELVAETLVLSLDPYPRKPGAAFPGVEFGFETPSSSFADLAILRQPGKPKGS